MSVLLYEAENLRGCDRLKPGLLLPQFSHTHTAAVNVFLQKHLPKEYFPWGIDCHRHPSFLCWERHTSCHHCPLAPNQAGKHLF